MTTTFYKIETTDGEILNISQGALRMSSTLTCAALFLEHLDEAIPIYDFDSEILELLFDYCEKSCEEKMGAGPVGWRPIPVDKAEKFYEAAEYLGIDCLCQSEEYY